MSNNASQNTTQEPLQLPGYTLPASGFLSESAAQALQDYSQAMQDFGREISAKKLTTTADKAELFHQTPLHKTLLTQYPVAIEPRCYAGINVDVFTPLADTENHHRERVLINLYGSNFEASFGIASHMESIPLAALGGIKVISVDYRTAPEHRFPAATEDVIAVYTELLKHYPPQHIGLVGSSAGARLASQVLVQLQQRKIPTPGAIAMIAWSAADRLGDSMAMAAPILLATSGYDLATATIDYLHNTKVNDPQVTPAVSDTVMAQFPPTLLASSSRDWLLSSVTACHRQLCRLGVETELHIWDGLDHCFHHNPFLPEARELHQTTADFFNHHLREAAPND